MFGYTCTVNTFGLYLNNILFISVACLLSCDNVINVNVVVVCFVVNQLMNTQDSFTLWDSNEFRYLCGTLAAISVQF